MPALTEKQREYYRQWRIKHKERLKVYNKMQYKKHKVKILSNAAIKYKEEKINRNNSHFFKVRDNKRFLNKLKALQKVSGLQIPECCICGIKDPRILNINHINGKGGIDSRKYGNMSIAVNRGRDIKDLDVRCNNCNILYEFERGKRGPMNWKELYNNLTKRNK